MASRRRIATVLLVLLVLGGLIAGGVWYFVRDRGEAWLHGAELALKAGNYEKARRLAQKYIREAPGEAEGYFVLGQILVREGSFEEAREHLHKAWKLDPSQLKIVFAIADSYRRAYQLNLSRKGGVDDLTNLERAIYQLQQAYKFLQGINVSDTSKALDLQEYLGRVRMFIGRLEWRRGEVLREGSERAKINPLRKADWPAKGTLSREALDRSDEAFHDAIRILLGVIQSDPGRGRTGEELLRMCRERGDERSYDLAKKAIMTLAAPPADAALFVLLDELSKFSGERDAEVRRKELIKTGQALDRLRTQHPDHLKLKLVRAQVGLRLGELTVVDTICREVLAEAPKNLDARFMHAQLLGMQGKVDESERAFYRLATEYRTTPRVVFAHARAALKAGKPGLALEAMQRVKRLEGEYGPARTYLARLLLQKGLDEDAYVESEKGYQLQPNDPLTLKVYVEACVRTGRRANAVEALDRVRTGVAKAASVMMAAADGYDLLGRHVQAREMAQRTVDAPATSSRDRYAAARAMVLLGRSGEAETALFREIKQQGSSPEFRQALGQLYERDGKLLQAAEQYRLAVREGSTEPDTMISLARVLLNAGQAREARNVLSRVDVENPRARVLLMQAQVVLGEKINPASLIQQVKAGQHSGLRLALSYFAGGQTDECIRLCKTELLKTPDSVEVLLLLGQAYFVQNRLTEGIDAWTRALKYAPDRLATYVALARMMRRTGKKPADVGLALKNIPDARSTLAALAQSRIEADARDYKAAAATLDHMLAGGNVPDHVRGQASLLRATYLARTNQPDQALQELDTLTQQPAWAKTALRQQAAILLSAGRFDEADSKLTALRGLAERDRDGVTLRNAATAYLQMYARDRRRGEGKQPAPRMKWLSRTKAVCQQHQRLLPDDPQSWLLWAGLWRILGKPDDEIRCYRKAIERRPGHLRTYLTLTARLTKEGRHDEALAVLDQLAKVSQTGLVTALSHRAALLMRWGLPAEAAKQLEAMTKTDLAESPRIQYRLAKAFVSVELRLRAREILRALTQNPRYEIAAGLMLVDLAPSYDEKLQRLAALDEKYPGRAEILVAMMRVLIDRDRPKEAAQLFNTFIGQYKRVPSAAGILALVCCLQTADTRAATNLALRMYEVTGLPSWHRVAALLAIRDRGDLAARMLPPPGKADLSYALMGLCHAAIQGQAKDMVPWLARLRGGQKARTVSAGGPHRLLVDLLAPGVKPTAAAVRMAAIWNRIPPKAAEDLAAQPASPARRAEVVDLITSAMALEMDMPTLARTWLLGALKRRGQSQWAAELLLRAEPEEADLTQALTFIRPADGRMALRFQAQRHLLRREYAQAARAFGQAAAAGPADAALLLSQARADEAAGRLSEALDVCRRGLAAAATPTVLDEAAHLASRLAPNRPALLGEARAWADRAVRGDPKNDSYRLTLGRILVLQGQTAAARKVLRAVIAQQRDRVAAHYYLALAEAGEGGSRKLSDWHLAEAVRRGNLRLARGTKLSSDESECLHRALAERKRRGKKK